MDANLIYIILGLVGTLFAGYKWNLFQKSKLLVDLMKSKDQNETSRVKYDLENMEKQVELADQQRLRAKEEYEKNK